MDFGPEIGTRKTSAQITKYYTPESLIGRQVAGVVNFPKKQVGPFMSEFLCLGFPDGEDDKGIVLIAPERLFPTYISVFLTRQNHCCFPRPSNRPGYTDCRRLDLIDCGCETFD